MKSRLSAFLLIFILLITAAGCEKKTTPQVPSLGQAANKESSQPTTIRSGNIIETKNMRVRSPYSIVPGQVPLVEITGVAGYLRKYAEWNTQLTTLKQNLDSAYSDWAVKRITTLQYREKAAVLAIQMQELNNQADMICSFNLTAQESERINEKLITRTYLLTSKALWDYLYDLANDQIPESQIASGYEQQIKGAFEPREQELARLLEQAR